MYIFANNLVTMVSHMSLISQKMKKKSYLLVIYLCPCVHFKFLIKMYHVIPVR